MSTSSPSSEVAGASAGRRYSFTGTYQVKLAGGRARLVLPSVWREQIGGPVKVGPCPLREGVRVYPPDEFDRIVDQLYAAQLDNQVWARQLSSWLARHYYEVTPDTAGRIELPSGVSGSFTWPSKDEVVLTGGHRYVLILAEVADPAPVYIGLPDYLPAYI